MKFGAKCTYPTQKQIWQQNEIKVLCLMPAESDQPCNKKIISCFKTVIMATILLIQFKQRNNFLEDTCSQHEVEGKHVTNLQIQNVFCDHNFTLPCEGNFSSGPSSSQTYFWRLVISQSIKNFRRQVFC